MINSHNSGSVIMVISEQRNRTSVPYHNSVHSEQYCALNHWSFICTSHYQRGLGHSLHPIISNLLTRKDYCTLMTEKCLYTKPVTCSEGHKVPFAVTRHKWLFLTEFEVDIAMHSIYNGRKKIDLRGSLEHAEGKHGHQHNRSKAITSTTQCTATNRARLPTCRFSIETLWLMQTGIIEIFSPTQKYT